MGECATLQHIGGAFREALSHILTLYTGDCERQGYRSRRGRGFPRMALDRLRRRDG